MPRRHQPELMDDPNVDPAQLRGALAFLRAFNARFAGTSPLLHHLRRWSARWPKGRPITLLDIATGSADLPIAAVRWARAAGHDLRVTAIDLHERTLDAARDHLRQAPDAAPFITLERRDALQLTTHYQPRSFDYVHASLFLHHLPNDVVILTMLAIMDKLAARGLLWNDLLRSPLARLGALALTARAPKIVRHDAFVSIDAAFTRAEALDLAHRAGITYATLREQLFAQRFVLAGERPDLA